jgi:hypothetical protein
VSKVSQQTRVSKCAFTRVCTLVLTIPTSFLSITKVKGSQGAK